MIRKITAATAFALALGTASAPAWAGPCSDDIAAIGKQLSGTPQLGPPSTGTLTGSVTGAGAAKPALANTAGTTAGEGKMGGTAATKELDAASSNVATSPADVRRQQLNKPTAAQQAGAGTQGVETASHSSDASSTSTDDSVSRAKTAWQQAVDLNARNDSSCKTAVRRAQEALRAG